MKIQKTIVTILLMVCLEEFLMASHVENALLTQQDTQGQSKLKVVDNPAITNKNNNTWEGLSSKIKDTKNLITFETALALYGQGVMNEMVLFLNALDLLTKGKITYEYMMSDPIIQSVLNQKENDMDVKDDIETWVNDHNETLLLAIGCTIDTINLLISLGLDINKQDIKGNTLLHVAAFCNNSSDIVTFLLNNGAKLNIQSESGNTPLHVASMMNNIQIVQLLLDHGADITIKNNEGKTAEDKAKSALIKNLLAQARIAHEEELDAAIWF